MGLYLRPSLIQLARRVASEAQTAVHLPPGCLFGFRFEGGVELDAVFQQLCDVGIGAQLANQSRGVKGRATRQTSTLENEDVLPAELGEVVRRAAWQPDRGGEALELDVDAAGKWSPSLFAKGIGIAVVTAIVTSRIGLAWGKGLLKVRR